MSNNRCFSHFKQYFATFDNRYILRGYFVLFQFLTGTAKCGTLSKELVTLRENKLLKKKEIKIESMTRKKKMLLS